MIDFERLKKRVIQIAGEVSNIEVSDEDTNIEIAKKLKLIAVEYECVLVSWCASAYKAHCIGSCEIYEDQKVEIVSDREEIAVIIAFKWLADKGFFTNEIIVFENEEV